MNMLGEVCQRNGVGESRVSEKSERWLGSYSLLLLFFPFDCVNSISFIFVSIYFRLVPYLCLKPDTTSRKVLPNPRNDLE